MLTKLLFTIGIIMAVWRLWPIAQRLLKTLGDRASRDEPETGRRAIEMVRCPSCGSYVEAGRPCDCGCGTGRSA